MTGSGSAVFGVFRSPARARAAFSSLALLYPSTFLAQPCGESIVVIED